MTISIWRRSSELALGLALCSCSGKTLEVAAGEMPPVNTTANDGGTQVRPPDLSQQAKWPESAACNRGAPELVGTWRGYTEAHAFPSGSDAITVSIQGTTADGKPCGSVIFGQG